MHALAPAPNGGLYVGDVARRQDLQGRSQRHRRPTFFDPDDKYIWALASDAKGNLYAGTGDKGVVYKITPDGKGTPFYQTKATHATALAFDKAGNLLVGTESPGRVLRVDPDGKAFLLLDSPFQEIRALRFDDKGMLYVAALSGRPPAARRRRRRTITVDRPTPATPRGRQCRRCPPEITSMSIVDVSGGAGSTGIDARGSPRAERRRLPHRARWPVG